MSARKLFGEGLAADRSVRGVNSSTAPCLTWTRAFSDQREVEDALHGLRESQQEGDCGLLWCHAACGGQVH
jgi:hypothetical protein